MKKSVKTKKEHVVNKSIVRSTSGLRNALFDELDLLRKGKITPQRANTFARGAIAIVGTARLELDYTKLNKGLAKDGKRQIESTTLFLG